MFSFAKDKRIIFTQQIWKLHNKNSANFSVDRDKFSIKPKIISRYKCELCVINSWNSVGKNKIKMFDFLFWLRCGIFSFDQRKNISFSHLHFFYSRKQRSNRLISRRFVIIIILFLFFDFWLEAKFNCNSEKEQWFFDEFTTLVKWIR